MAADNKNQGYSQQAKTGKPKEVNRGTQDELEILGLVVAQLPVLRNHILEKLRVARDRVSKRQQKLQNDAKIKI